MEPPENPVNTAGQLLSVTNDSLTSPASPATAASASLAPVVAQDSDTIEPEWVGAVKQLMVQYKHDPYALAQAMTALREDYLAKRYGRNVKAE